MPEDELSEQHCEPFLLALLPLFFILARLNQHRGKFQFITAILPILIAVSCTAKAEAITLSSPAVGLSVSLDETTGAYGVSSRVTGWTLAGTLGGPAGGAAVGHGTDRTGSYQELVFRWGKGAFPMVGRVRLYEARPTLLFTNTYPGGSAQPFPVFPDFSKIPEGLHPFSYNNIRFAPPQFSFAEGGSPWLLFDNADNALIISPASHFFVAKMQGVQSHHITSGFNIKLRALPEGLSQSTLLTLGKGINKSWEEWGGAMKALAGNVRPANDADLSLKYFGYWTDNFATYYYHYDMDKGYAGTLLALADHYRQQGIPLHYLQLDSWWYYKTLTGPDGRLGRPKNMRLPMGEWNRYGGLLKYRAHTDLFPEGLNAFHKAIGLPFITHNRWIDRASPYHKNYQISGLGAVDPRWWDDIAAYLKDSGVVTYEQDWLDEIYQNSPQFPGGVDTGQIFLDNMARACKANGLTMQYCMALPCYFLQGSAYDNLTTIRTSDDGFVRSRWNDFLYTSRLASALGIWPWTDVCRSTDAESILLSTLSAGPVGIGDAIGKENKANIFQSIRPDGVIVKPDTSIVPLDSSYINDAQKLNAPLIASAFTDHAGHRTAYVFAFTRGKRLVRRYAFTPAELGFSGPVYAYDTASGQGYRLLAGGAYEGLTGRNGSAYTIVAPIGPSGIAFFGDMSKFVSTGKARIPTLTEDPDGLTATVLFAPGEPSITLHGYSPRPPQVTVTGGVADPVHFDPLTHHFTVEIQPTGPLSQGAADEGVTVRMAVGRRVGLGKVGTNLRQGNGI